MSSPKNSSGPSKQAGRDNKRPIIPNRTPSKSGSAVSEAKKDTSAIKVGDGKSSQTRQRTASGTASSRPRASSTQVKKPSGETPELEPEAASPAVESTKTKSSAQARKSAGDEGETGTGGPSTVEEEEAPGVREPNAVDEAFSEGTTDAATVDDGTAEKAGKEEEEEKPELEKVEHDLGEVCPEHPFFVCCFALTCAAFGYARSRDRQV